MIPAPVKIIAMGCSAGCFESLMQLLPALKAPFGAAVVVLLHISPEGDSMLADTFSRKCSLPVKEAEDKEKISPGVIYFAPPGYHLQTEINGEFSLSTEEPVFFSRPSIDILFESVADAYGPAAVGIVMSGASEDGAEGLRKISLAGGYTVVENPQLARYPTMPAAALGKHKPSAVLSVPELLAWLPTLGGPHAR